MARRSCPLEDFERCDTVPDGLNDLNRRFLGLGFFTIRELDLFSKSRVTKHCKWVLTILWARSRQQLKASHGRKRRCEGIANIVLERVTRLTSDL
jgi:hypothetical protein